MLAIESGTNLPEKTIAQLKIRMSRGQKVFLHGSVLCEI
jgi:hypothetical protein